MLSKKSTQLLNFVFSALTLFCIMPYDWDSKSRKLTKTKYALRRYLNKAITYGLPGFLVYFTFCLAISYTYYDLPLLDLSRNGLMLIIGYMTCYVGLSVTLYGEDAVDFVNCMFKLDQIYQDKFFHDDESPEQYYGSRYELLIKASWIIEPLSVIQSFLIGFMFFEKFDMYRTYIYSFFLWIAGFEDNIWLQMGAVLLYMGIIRIMYSFMIIAFYTLGMYAQITGTWLQFHQNVQRIDLKNNGELATWYFQTEQFMNQLYHSSKTIRNSMTVVFTGAFAGCVAGNYLTITLIGKVGTLAYLAPPSLSILIISALKLWFKYSGKLSDDSTELLRLWIESAHEDQVVRRQLKALRPIKFRIGNFFSMNNSTFLDFQSQVLDNTINLVLA